MDDLDRALEILQREGLAKLLSRARGRTLLKLVELLKSPWHVDSAADAYHALFDAFFAQVNALPAPRVLELGSRARSGTLYRTRLGAHARYTGLDLLAGENVDVVGDAHELSTSFAPGSFDAVFCVSVFEHLAMPWKVALELNQVLAPGGLVFIATHPTYPPHELPADFWRFNKAAFSALLNASTGFEVLRCEEGLPCAIVPLAGDPPLVGLWREQGHLGVAAIARKIGPADPRLSWPVPSAGILESKYPSSSQ